MQNIPVGETVASAYGFAFAGFPSVLGTMWLPLAVLLAFDAAVVMLLAPDLPGYVMRGEFDMALIWSFHRIEGLLWLGAFIIRAMTTVGLQERALGRTKGPAYFYFSLGRPVWRMVGAEFLAILVIAVIATLTACAAILVAYLAVVFISHGGYAVAGVAGVVAVCWLVYATVRLFFFLPAVVVAESRIGLIRSWELSQGNFWRIVGIALAVFVPVWIGLHIVLFAVIEPMIPLDMLARFHSGMLPGDIQELAQAITKRIFLGFRGILPFLVAFSLVEQLLYAGLGNGASASAYLAVTGKGGAP